MMDKCWCRTVTWRVPLLLLLFTCFLAWIPAYKTAGRVSKPMTPVAASARPSMMVPRPISFISTFHLTYQPSPSGQTQLTAGIMTPHGSSGSHGVVKTDRKSISDVGQSLVRENREGGQTCSENIHVFGFCSTGLFMVCNECVAGAGVLKVIDSPVNTYYQTALRLIQSQVLTPVHFFTLPHTSQNTSLPILNTKTILPQVPQVKTNLVLTTVSPTAATLQAGQDNYVNPSTYRPSDNFKITYKEEVSSLTMLMDTEWTHNSWIHPTASLRTLPVTGKTEAVTTLVHNPQHWLTPVVPLLTRPHTTIHTAAKRGLYIFNPILNTPKSTRHTPRILHPPTSTLHTLKHILPTPKR
ncbi:hypothetical protein OTU49_012881, partial [Cherax quadricarinatus]